MTLDQLKAQIASRLTRRDLEPDIFGVNIITDMVLDRVDYYKSDCFYSGQVYDTSITTVAGTPAYAIPEGWEELYQINILQGGATWITLTRESIAYLDSLDVTSPSQRQLPTCWTLFGTNIRLGGGAPDGAYPLSILMNIPPGVPSMGSGTNFWTTDAKSLIINGVCAEIADTYLDNPQMAARFRPLEQRELSRLQAKSMRHAGSLQVDFYL